MAAALLLRLWSITWRKRVIGREHLDRLTRQRRRTLMLFWHGHYLPLFTLLRGCRGCALTNHSFRGQVIAEICRRFGYPSLQLPEGTGRRLRVGLRQAMADHSLWGTAADGPLGPAHQVKGTTMKLAAHFGFTLLPMAVSARHAWHRRKRWDRMALPWPGTRMALVIGPPLKPPATLGEREARRWAGHIETAITECVMQAEEVLSEEF
jgi:hypothetical protein